MAQTIGVKLANGFDPSSAVAHGKNAREIIALHRLGLSSITALRAATTQAAELMELQDQIGSIGIGKYADLIAVPGDPVKDITELERVCFVMKAGMIIKNERTVK